MKRKNLFINILVIFLIVIGLGISSFLVYALAQEKNTSKDIKVTQGEEASAVEPTKDQNKKATKIEDTEKRVIEIGATKMSLVLIRPQPLFWFEEEEKKEEL